MIQFFDNNIYSGKKVLVTGHTGFKGSWLSLWLKEFGAEVFGLSKDMDDKTKCRILRQEYSRWNSQTNNSNKDKRVRAKEMVNLIANLRKQYNC